MTRRFHVDPSERIDIYEFEPEEILSDTPPNVITIRARMDIATAGKVQSEMAKLGADNKPELYIGEHVGALLLHNILGWHGPDFDDLPCTPANIRALPSADSDPFIEKVANAIGERNKKRASPNARSATSSTLGSAGAAALQPNALASGQLNNRLSERLILKSHAPNDSIGHQNRSDD